jgi:phosphonoacetate hydrolase
MYHYIFKHYCFFLLERNSRADKLLRLLQAGLDTKTSTSLSVEFAESEGARDTLGRRGLTSATSLMNGVTPPGIYDPDISIYALAMGHKLLELDHTTAATIVPSMYYLSTTDYVQHKWAPGEPQANDFYSKVDAVIGRLDQAGAIVGLTADHGMNSKIRYDGSPKVIYIETLLKEAGYTDYRVILPITDPYVKHHGALGSYATSNTFFFFFVFLFVCLSFVVLMDCYMWLS